MNELSPRLTEQGKYYIIEALNGKALTFTKIVLGDGTPSSSSPTSLANQRLEVGITDITVDNNCAILKGYFDNSDVEEGFYMKELGVYAENEEEDEVLYAYRYQASDVDYVPAADSGNVVESTLSIVVAVGDAENVDAVIIEGDQYASKEDFNSHINNFNNPHHVTKEDVGLGNVPNVETNYQAVTYTEAGSLALLASGEALSIAFGKIAKAIRTLINHIDNNVLHITSAERTKWNGKADATHKHSAADITSGTLPVSRGGTGATTLHALQSKLKIPGEYIETTLLASNWANNTYSFETTYDNAKYNLSIAISPTATKAQRSAYSAAGLAGAYDKNRITALGYIPEIDIPVIIKVMEVL